jgi:hypothetical protein
LHYARRGRLGPALRGKWSALARLPVVLAERREVQRHTVVDVRELEQLMEPRWLSLKRREKDARRD